MVYKGPVDHCIRRTIIISNKTIALSFTAEAMSTNTSQLLQAPSRMAHHWGCIAIALTSRCTILKRKSCKRGSAVNMLRGVPSGRLAPVQKTYWQDIKLEKIWIFYKMSTQPLRKQRRAAKRYCRGFLELIAQSIKVVALWNSNQYCEINCSQ